MPQVIVAADGGDVFGDGAVTLRERVNVEDFESRHFATQLVERIGWAVEDADRVEQRDDSADAGPGAERESDDDPAWSDRTSSAREGRVTAQSPA